MSEKVPSYIKYFEASLDACVRRCLWTIRTSDFLWPLIKGAL